MGLPLEGKVGGPDKASVRNFRFEVGELTPDGLLPPVLPIVLYNGKALWGAARDVAELVATIPSGLQQYRPQLRYCLLDEGRIAASELESLQNLSAALIRLERSRSPEDVLGVLESLLKWLNDPELSELRRSFATWMQEILLPARLPGAKIPKLAELQEVKSMLAERVVEWTQEWKQEGFQEGIEKGIEKGKEQVIETLRGVLLAKLEERFSPLPQETRRHVEAVTSAKALAELIARSGTAPSLESLGLS